jgi:hypothetical protein
MEMEAAPTVILLISVICKEEEAATKEEVSCFAVVTADVAAGFRLYYFLSIPFFDSLINNRNIIRGRSNALLEMDQLEPSVFKRMFRVDRATFGEIMERITPFIQAKNLRKACNSSGAPILLKARLAVTLRQQLLSCCATFFCSCALEPMSRQPQRHQCLAPWAFYDR